MFVQVLLGWGWGGTGSTDQVPGSLHAVQSSKPNGSLQVDLGEQHRLRSGTAVAPVGPLGVRGESEESTPGCDLAEPWWILHGFPMCGFHNLGGD